MEKIISDKEIINTFTKNTLEKIFELNGIVNVLLKEGKKPEFFDAIQRIITSIKYFSLTCNQINIINYITSNIEPDINVIRIEQTDISDEVKKNLKNNISYLKEMINNINKSDLLNLPSDITIESINNTHSLLTSIGQLSVWSFHDLMNSLAKIHGYTEFLDDIYQKIPDSENEIKKDLRTIQEKLISNVSNMTGIINRIRSLRGKTKIDIKEYSIINVINNIQENTQQPPKTMLWSANNIPNVNVEIDRIIFEQIWVHLWKLLEEWQIPGTLIQSNCFGEIQFDKNSSNQKFKNLLHIYIWNEINGSQKFEPTSLQYSSHTPQADLAFIFQNTSIMAKKTSINIKCAKALNNSIVFNISIPCNNVNDTIIEQKKSVINQFQSIKTQQESNKSSKNVLLLDDDTDLRTILSLKLIKMGYNVSLAENLTEAHIILDTKEINLVISDIFLVRETGIELLKNLCINSPEIPFIFITGANEDDISKPILDILSKYSKAFLTKPIQTQTLKEVLDKIIPL